MRPRERRETGEQDLFRSRLDHHRHEAFAGDAGAHGGLGLPGAGVRSGLHGWPWPAATADALDDGARDSQTHL